MKCSYCGSEAEERVFTDRNIFNVPFEDLTVKLDKETIDYLQKEAQRSNLRADIVAACILRNAVSEGKKMDL